MSTFSKQFLSAAVSGNMIGIGTTASPGTTVHAAGVAGAIDELWLWATNTGASPVALTVEWGGTTSGNVYKQTIPAQEGLFEICPGLPILSGVTVRAYAATSGVLNIVGFVNRIS